MNQDITVRQTLASGLILPAIILAACGPVPDAKLSTADDGERCIDGGTFRMGSDAHYAEEKPIRTVEVEPFCIDLYEITNDQFAEFVLATGYSTVAERGPDEKDYPNAPQEFFQPGSAIFVMPEAPSTAKASQWWQFSRGAYWRKPLGNDSSIDRRGDHPVVHIAFNDALAYARWQGRDLPTEAEWEYAARDGLVEATYAWGEERAPKGLEFANTWQGEFPLQDLAHDGYSGTAPVGRFPANNYGLYDMIGNVWEWTKDDFSGPGYQQSAWSEQRVIKGGSFLCAPNYCARYRPAARQAQDTGLGTNHIGFRTVRRPQ